MSTGNLIKGLTTLQKYRDNDGYFNGAEEGVIFASRTDRPLTNEDIQVMIDAGWHQEDAIPLFSVKYYDREHTWLFYT